MPRYVPPETSGELMRVAAALNELETDSIQLKEWNVAPEKLYNGLVVYADGTNWDPGSGRGVYAYENGSWVKLG